MVSAPELARVTRIMECRYFSPGERKLMSVVCGQRETIDCLYRAEAAAGCRLQSLKFCLRIRRHIDRCH
jgi:hypothetical protein